MKDLSSIAESDDADDVLDAPTLVRLLVLPLCVCVMNVLQILSLLAWLVAANRSPVLLVALIPRRGALLGLIPCSRARLGLIPCPGAIVVGEATVLTAGVSLVELVESSSTDCTWREWM